jgi:hypothetical protein
MSGIANLLADDRAAPMTLEDWEALGDHLARCEVHGNDGPDVWEAEEFIAALRDEYACALDEWAGLPINARIQAMETWVERKMGAAFDPEKHCRYTGRKLWKFPLQGWDARCLMGYYREPDGHLMRVRDCTPGEVEWITGNPAAFQAAKGKFERWLSTCRLDG